MNISFNRSSSSNNILKVVVLCGVLALLGICAQIVITRHGIGVSPDSVIYIGTARTLIEGHRLGMPTCDGGYAPMTQYAPLFPLALAGTGLLGVDPLDGARWLNAFFFGANTLLVGLLIHKYTPHLGAALAGALLFMASGDILRVHLWAWTEPSFIFLMLLGLMLLQIHVDTGDRYYLAGAAVTIALAFLDRYAGAALVWAGVGGILVLGKGSIRERVCYCLCFGAITCLLMALWMARNFAEAETMTNRTLAFYPIRAQEFKDGLLVVSQWVLPARLPTMLKITLPLAALAGIIFLSIRSLWIGGGQARTSRNL